MKKRVLLSIACGLVVVWGYHWMMSDTIRVAETAAQYGESWIPASATNIVECRSGAFGADTHIEFRCDKETFLQWIESERLREPATGPVGEAPPVIIAYNLATREREEIEITNGLAASYTLGDVAIHYTYDLDTTRAYCSCYGR